MTSDANTGFKFSIHHDSLFVLRDENRALATAFSFIKPEWVVTAKHAVLEMGVPRRNLSLQSRRGEPLKVSILFLHPSHDLAVLGIEGQSPCDVPLFPGYEGYTGSNGLVGCGYAPSWPNKEGYSHTIVAHRITTYEREERSRDTGDESVIVFDAPWIEGGYSGGPIFGEGGAVVAVLIEVMRPDDGATRGRATSILHLLRFLTYQPREVAP